MSESLDNSKITRMRDVRFEIRTVEPEQPGGLPSIWLGIKDCAYVLPLDEVSRLIHHLRTKSSDSANVEVRIKESIFILPKEAAARLAQALEGV